MCLKCMNFSFISIKKIKEKCQSTFMLLNLQKYVQINCIDLQLAQSLISIATKMASHSQVNEKFQLGRKKKGQLITRKLPQPLSPIYTSGSGRGRGAGLI